MLMMQPWPEICTQGEGGAEVTDGTDLGVQWSAQTAVEFGESGGFSPCDPSSHTKCEEGKGYLEQNHPVLAVLKTGVLHRAGGRHHSGIIEWNIALGKGS